MRLERWEKALADYLLAAEKRQFSYGAFDCCLFAADVVMLLRGFDPASQLRGYKTKEDAEAIIKRYGGMSKLAHSIIQASGFPEIDKPHAQRGDLVFARLSGGTLGIVGGSHAIFPSTKSGLVHVPMSSPAVIKAWRVA